MSSAAARHQRLHAELRQRICLLDYPPGTKLSEEALAAEFGTSRTPLRRVLARLEDEGLVESRHGIGTLVTDVDMALMAQVYDLRLHLAALVGQLDPQPVTPARMAEIRAFVTRGEALLASPDPRVFAELNSAYHDFGLSLTGNAPLRETAARLYYLTARIWLTSIPRMDLASECAIFLGEMRETETALAAGDTAAAALIRRAHISMSVHRMPR
ncbi:GntR family transcriptional regulator [Salipiger bermudensis]|uniref:GntR family transcriptional regulator n=1 Tax=Salipiger bermudensis TaxID=344736 RepID=UPI001C98EB2D|nr:GntR family transcriptional regulator [Salipiger bermudensis]MBY6002602.1 GntR family transcriptional regulator [Salipiger bermudensis]